MTSKLITWLIAIGSLGLLTSMVLIATHESRIETGLAVLLLCLSALLVILSRKQMIR
jgi:Ca2+/Na+ antiporter